MPTPTLSYSIDTVYDAEGVNSGVLPLPVQVRAVVASAVDEFGDAIPDPYAHVEFAWDFGDNADDGLTYVEPTTNRRIDASSGQTGFLATHVYRRSGTFTVTCRAYYYDTVTQAYVSFTPQTVTITVDDYSDVTEWDAVYCDPDAVDSAALGTLADPFTTLAQLRAGIARKSKVVVHVAKGTLLAATADEPVLTITDVAHVRFVSYSPAGSTATTAPRLALASTSSARAVVDIAPSTGANAQNEQQTVALTNTPSSGSFSLTFRGETATIAYNANAATVQAALEALSTIGSGNVTVTGASPTWTVTFGGSLATTPLPLLVGENTSLSPSSSTVVVTRVASGSANVNAVEGIVFDGFTLDGNGAADSIGLRIMSASSTSHAMNIALHGCTVQGTLGNCVYMHPAVVDGDGPHNIVLSGTTFIHFLSAATGSTISVACTEYLSVIGCTFRAGLDDLSDYIEIGQFSTTQEQAFHLIKWCGFVATSTRRRCITIEGGVVDSLIDRCFISGARDGIRIDKDTADPVTHPNNIMVDACAFTNLGDATSVSGVTVGFATMITIRNNRFWSNGYAIGTTTGGDIVIEDCGGAEEAAADSSPIHIYHNSFHRSYEKGGTPCLLVDDWRYIKHYNNAYVHLGAPSGTSAQRSVVRFTEASYAQPAWNETQKVYFSSTPTTGTFRLDFNSNVTSSLDFDATAAEVQAALEALAPIGVGNVTVTGDDGGPYYVTFRGTLSETNVNAITVNSNTTGIGLNVTTIVNGAAGRFASDYNWYYGPNFQRTGSVKPLVLGGTTFVEFASDSPTADWQSVGYTDLPYAMFDEHGGSSNPEFRNGAAGNFKFAFNDVLADAGGAKGVRWDHYGTLRSSTPDIGCFEYDGATTDAPWSYGPSSLISLPVADAQAYFSGDVNYIRATEPLLVTGGDASEVDNRPHYNLAHRDNLLAAGVDALLQDINNAFCATPQTGSEFTAAHTTIEEWRAVAHNPDGTIKPEAIDLSALGFLRTDGGNWMRASLRLGEPTQGEPQQQIINMAAGSATGHGVVYEQVVLRDGTNTVTGSLTFASGATLNMGTNKITNVGAASATTDVPQLQQVVKRSGDTMSGNLTITAGGLTVSAGGVTVSAGGASITGGATITGAALSLTGQKITNLGSGTVATDGVRFDQVMLRSGANAATGAMNMGGFKIDNMAVGADSNDAATYGQVMLRDGTNAATGVMNMGGFKISNAGAAVSNTDLPQYQQVISVDNDDTKNSVLSMGAHNWVNSGVTGTNGHADYVAHTSMPTGGSAVEGTDPVASRVAADGYGINMNAVPYSIAFPASGADPYFDGQYIRNGPLHPTDPDEIANPYMITAATGNAIFNVPWPQLGHDVANKGYADYRANNPDLTYFDTQFDDDSDTAFEDPTFVPTLPYSQTGLAKGVYMWWVRGTVQDNLGGSTSQKFSVTVNAVTRSLRVNDYIDDGQIGITFMGVSQVSTDGGSLTIESTSNMGRLSGFMAVKIGNV